MKLRTIHILPVALLAGCGPSEAETGQAMLLWCALLLPLTVAFETLFSRIKYRKVTVPPRLAPKPIYILAAVPLAVCALSVAVRGWLGSEHIAVVGMIFAFGYLGYVGASFIGSHMTRRNNSSPVAVYVPYSAILVTSALATFLGSADSEVDTGIMFLTMPLVYGAVYFVGPALFALAFIWAGITPELPTPPIPPAKVRRG